ncbi:hypothetical protein GH714_024158 [Hevea brasiliensis]|uniref:Aminotransferase-like plant mobile domain-containing protein n=1 Tax=Hevea brasiliensis TaxID=3981 RepID=A0A6A6MLR3_HEVBR|nr:hypothetical protein GH714_024158 [Hevea brasiliensis]
MLSSARNASPTLRTAHFLNPTRASIKALVPKTLHSAPLLCLPLLILKIGLSMRRSMVGKSNSELEIMGSSHGREDKEIEDKLKEARSEVGRGLTRGVCQIGWMEEFMFSGSEIEHEAFLSLWLEMFVFHDSENTLRDCIFPIAIHLAKGEVVALAPAVLASIYRDLGGGKQSELDSHDLLKNAIIAAVRRKRSQGQRKIRRTAKAWIGKKGDNNVGIFPSPSNAKANNGALSEVKSLQKPVECIMNLNTEIGRPVRALENQAGIPRCHTPSKSRVGGENSAFEVPGLALESRIAILEKAMAELKAARFGSRFEKNCS